jgi:hypothetical protein
VKPKVVVTAPMNEKHLTDNGQSNRIFLVPWIKMVGGKTDQKEKFHALHLNLFLQLTI